jgi:osmotically-inducible protein OsmY
MKIAGKLTCALMAVACTVAVAADGTQSDSQKAPATATVTATQTSPRADNTDINQRDKGTATKTPQNQSNKDQDRTQLAAVRRAIVGEKSLSSMAHNVKILVENGSVTLRGPVKDAGEKAQVETLAKSVAGITGVDNQLDIKSNASKSNASGQ